MRRDDHKSLQPCLVPMPNPTICHNWLSHYYNCLTEMWLLNLDDWKRILAREAIQTIDLILIRHQSTCIEKDKQKTITKIRRHEKTNPSFNTLSSFWLSNPFFAQTVAIAFIIATHPDNQQWRMRPAFSPPPPPQPVAAAAAAASLHDPANI